MASSGSRALRLLAVVAVATAAWPQATPQPQTGPSASVTGKVTNSLTGAPVVRAHVIMQSDRPRFGALTTGEGKFSISELPPGHYTVRAEGVGFARAADSVQPLELEIRAGDKVDSVDLKLTPLGAITGRVLDASGEPVQLAEVVADGLAGGADATTDDKGRYRLGGLAPGMYRVKARTERMPAPLPPEIRTDGSKEVRYATTYYPGAQSAKEATRVTVGPGSEVSGIDIPLLGTPMVKVSGKVSDIPPGQHVRIEVMMETGPRASLGFERSARADGSFVFWGLEPGKYTLMASASGSGPGASRSAPFDLELGAGDVEHVDLRIVPPFDIAGRLQFEEPQARPKAVPEGPHRGMEPEVMLEPLGEIPMGDQVRSEIAAGDSVKLEKVQPGRYRVRLEGGDGGVYVTSLRLGSAETDGDILDVRNGAAGVLTLTISAVTGEISGTVRDSKGPIAAAIMQRPDGEDAALRAMADSSGSYSMTGLPPGKYRLLAVDDRIAALLEERGDLGDYEDMAETVELHAGEKITKDLKLVPPDK